MRIATRTICATLLAASLAACSLQEEEVVVVEPVVEEPVLDAIEERCGGEDGIGGTGCPAVD